ncbi:pentapeptide repeat-containing protein [Actinomadura sp. NEAU-AAG7]|uniref:pentapeptide repeat-containing protein n=1 Tax=Actinomadura sp. NEAU-AAG7 TaxID=2839640 RepID=UPI001BE475D3|nr:pentapeptide repeat-containing protein [Actinomadura sp. NEAU-AAG7]MBT2207097.1 pentapeptide repeat-containing protein [Actinomadura sp. NEAU-AAG7]
MNGFDWDGWAARDGWDVPPETLGGGQDAVDSLCGWWRRAGGEDPGVLRSCGRVLAAMLRAGDGLDVVLRGAVVVDGRFAGCAFGAVDFSDVRFVGDVDFAAARFGGQAVFQRVLCEGDAEFGGAAFAEAAVFGRARFRGAAGFAGARFGDLAWFGRGEDGLSEEDPAWDEIEDAATPAWQEPNEDDPHWPLAVLDFDYQEWIEGGDGARFAGPVTFRGAGFGADAWFGKARFGDSADFTGAVFGGPVHLPAPTVDLTGARADEAAEHEWPFGWRLHDGGLAAGRRDLADPAARLAGVERLASLGDAEPGARAAVARALCEYLRVPLPFAVTGPLTPPRAAELRARRAAQEALAARARPGGWPDLSLHLSGATLVDLDLSGVSVAYGDFCGAQFHGRTDFSDAVFERADFCLPGSADGRATFHGPADFTDARLGRHGSPVDGC